MVKEFDGLIPCHMRNEGLEIDAAIEELLSVGRASGVHVHVSHLKVDNYKVHGRAPEVWDILEKARADKRIGKALEARVTVFGDDAIKNATNDLNMAEICIVSAAEWAQPEEGAEVGQGVNLPGLTIGVSEAKGEKCPRCWMHSTDADENGLCKRCAAVVAKLDVKI